MVRMSLALLLGVVIACGSISAASADEYEVLMLNNGEAGLMVFEPALLRIEPGDTVRFVAEDKGHNSQSIDGMIPQGATAWRGAINEEIVVRFDVEGVYGYRCTPHYGMGMVGLVLVGDDLDNLDAAVEVRHPGKAQKVFEDLFGQVGQM